MKIKILWDIPVEESIRPKVGAIYDAQLDDYQTIRERRYKIQVNGCPVVILGHECEVLKEG